MIKAFLTLFCLVFAISNAQAQVFSQPSITGAVVQVFCQGTQPVANITLPINQSDVGLPGLIYMGMHDPAMTQAAFFTGGVWTGWQSGMFPVYSIVTSGLQTSTFTLVLPPNLAGGGWKLYMGYGALTLQNESRVQMAITAANAARAVKEQAIVAAVDPDQYRRSLIQMDMVQFSKYAYINTGVENNPYVCKPQNEGG